MDDKYKKANSIYERVGYLLLHVPFYTPKDLVVTFKSKKTIRSYKNKYAGKRCFIIGNGPSLTVSDLEKLKNEYTFGSNCIFKIFKETAWRPTFYVAQDRKLLDIYWNEIENLDITSKFIPLYIGEKCRYSNTVIYPMLWPWNPYPKLPNFSEDVSKVIYEGYTVTYSMIQIAVYMGFEEIYIIGCDHSYSVEQKADGSIVEHEGVRNHFSSDYGADDWKSGKYFVAQLDKSTLAYMAARKYADAHNIKIFNATRGGKLEVFERVSFDELFENGSLL